MMGERGRGLGRQRCLASAFTRYFGRESLRRRPVALGTLSAPTRGLPFSEALFRDFCFGHVEGNGIAFGVAELEGFVAPGHGLEIEDQRRLVFEARVFGVDVFNLEFENYVQAGCDSDAPLGLRSDLGGADSERRAFKDKLGKDRRSQFALVLVTIS
jgi:hypothetical protein